jgi:hypothetical protein
MKRIYLFLLILLFTSPAFSQQFSIGVRGGFGMYSMDLLNQFQQYRTNGVQLPLKITENYPITPFYRGELALNDMKYIDKIAVFYGFFSTGARSAVSDYSGYANLDAVINGNQFGLTVQKDFYKKGLLSVAGSVDASYLFSKLKTTDVIEIYDLENMTEKQEYSLVANGFAVEPGLVASCRLKPFIFQVNLGYLVDFSKKLHLNNNKDMVLSVYNEPVKPQWTGLKFGLQISYLFKKSEKQNIE